MTAPAYAPPRLRLRRHQRTALILTAAAALAITAAAPSHADPLPRVLPISTASPAVVQQFPDFGTCHPRPGADGQQLPDLRCSGGALSSTGAGPAAVARICAPGWAATQKITPAVYEKERRLLALAYGTSEAAVRGAVIDHVVPVELGGAPNDPRNLWLQTPDAAARKNNVEQKLVKAVCDGRMKAVLAQRLIADDWTRVKIVHTVGGLRSTYNG